MATMVVMEEFHPSFKSRSEALKFIDEVTCIIEKYRKKGACDWSPIEFRLGVYPKKDCWTPRGEDSVGTYITNE